MPRKTHFKKSKRGSKNMRKSIRRSKRIPRSLYKKSRKYRGRGGCADGTCLTETTTPQWISKGGTDTELISKDIYNHTTDQMFYSSAN